LKARKLKMGVPSQRVKWKWGPPFCTPLHTLHTH